MKRSDASPILADRISIKQVMLAFNPTLQLPKPQTWRAIFDIAFDWTAIFLSIWSVYRLGAAITPAALIVIGNRQRALGNLLHEASHGNLSNHRFINDCLAHLLLAAPLLNNLHVYRDLHARHHAWLGDSRRDPDWLPSFAHAGDQWYHAYARCLITRVMLRGLFAGHLSRSHANSRQRLGILSWWMITALALLGLCRLPFALLFVLLWFSARITVFHAITTFREMTDHYGLTPGGIFSFTREIPGNGVLSWLIHPHHNGYHLTHHLFPSIPYHQLPKFYEQLANLNDFAKRALVCHAYVGGSPSGVQGWGVSHE